jgi:hypothetical protein
MPELSTIYDYLRANALLLGTRILEQFPALHQVHDPLSPRIEGLLRKPFPAQAIAIMGLARRWQEARTGMVVAECGTGKTLISLGAIHVHSEGRPFTALAMVPPHLVEKWAREAFLTLPGVRVFFIDDLRNGGLVPNRVSKPSVVWPNGVAITPALAMTTSNGFPFANGSSAHARS